MFQGVKDSDLINARLCYSLNGAERRLRAIANRLRKIQSDHVVVDLHPVATTAAAAAAENFVTARVETAAETEAALRRLRRLLLS